jgi:hypothetical protein
MLLRVQAAWPLMLVLAPAPFAFAQSVIGPSKCTGCHDHERQARKWSKEEPAALRGHSHFGTRAQLEAPKSAAFARAVGLTDPYDVKGSCVRCHATVFRGDAGAGVSCESCHGPGSGYNDLHQVKGSYAKAVAAGMRDLRAKPAKVGVLCVECHVTGDRRLAAAGHPVGAQFDAGGALAKILHWSQPLDPGAVSAAARAAAAPRIASAGKPGPGAPNAPPPPPAPGGPPPAAADAPFDWDQPIRPLPSDYVPEPAQAEEAPRPRRAAPPPPSLAEDLPLAEATVAEVAPPPRATRGAAAATAEARGKAVQVLDRLLRAGARAPLIAAPTRPREYQGPDGELLRLQDEAMALALEALRRP